MTSKHNKDQWKINYPVHGAFGISAIDPKDGKMFCVADVYGIDAAKDEDCETALANAKLIAAAPTMLAALQAAKHYIDRDDVLQEVFAAIEMAGYVP